LRIDGRRREKREDDDSKRGLFHAVNDLSDYMRETKPGSYDADQLHREGLHSSSVAMSEKSPP
jgi:hypothetical protein